MLCNLPEELQERKLQVLRDAITASFGTRPTTFRTGRWGYSGRVAHALHRTGYAVDSSLTPHVDCRRQHGQDFSEVDLHPYSFDPKRFLTPDPDGPMLEVPATIGFLGPTGRLARLSDLGPRHRTAQRRLIRILERARLLRKVWLSPETASATDMIAVTSGLRRLGVPLVNLFFHSSALLPGLTPTVATAEDRARFFANLRTFLEFTRRSSIESVLLSEAAAVIPGARHRVPAGPAPARAPEVARS